jgi:predicted nucleic acid-binding protein
MASVCVDACFLIGLYDKDDQYHTVAARQFDALFGESSKRHRMIAPWPILYECLGSRYARDPRKSSIFNQRWNYLLESDQLQLLDDRSFREIALDEHLFIRSRPLSLVDRVLRAMIEDPRHPFEFFLTYNTRDFEDVCRAGEVLLLNEHTLPESYDI